MTLDSTGAMVGEQRYYPFGETRPDTVTGGMPTDRLFTGQRDVGLGGLIHFNARIYSGTLGRFISTDTIVPEWTNPQSLNRYSYVYNNPVRHTDSNGHCIDGLTTVGCIIGLTALAAFAGGAVHYQWNVQGHSWWEDSGDVQGTVAAGGQWAGTALAVDTAILALPALAGEAKRLWDNTYSLRVRVTASLQRVASGGNSKYGTMMPAENAALERLANETGESFVVTGGRGIPVEA